jgi:hypothetical protein
MNVRMRVSDRAGSPGLPPLTRRMTNGPTGSRTAGRSCPHARCAVRGKDVGRLRRVLPAAGDAPRGEGRLVTTAQDVMLTGLNSQQAR